CRMDVTLTPDLKASFDELVKEHFNGVPLQDISTVKIQTLAASLGAKALSMSALLATIADLAEMASQADIRLEGKSNLLGYKEYSENLPALLKFLGDEEPLNMLVSSGEGSGPGIEVRIGSENRFSELANSTTIIARYRIGDGATGAIGIIGPTRMNYSKLIPSIQYLSDIVSKVLSEVYEEDTLTNERNEEETD
ncbi:MAG: hypothetical protein J6T14_03240, partial [Clostridia bacterium]|nr:hypothetical protein [Clostridia bacterium]